MAALAISGFFGLGGGMKTNLAISAFVLALCATITTADEHKVDGHAKFMFAGDEINIAPSFPYASTYAAKFAAIEPSCDPFCIAAPVIAAGIETLVEADVIEFLVSAVGKNRGLLVDGRMPAERAMGYIPGSVNLPFETVEPSNEFREEILKALGARAFEGVFNFANAQNLVVYDNGPTQNDAGVLISHLLEAGYPPQKIRYYRGGMQVWSVLGLTIQE